MKWSDIWEIWEICEISWDRAKWWPDWGKMSRRWLLWGPNWELNKVLVTSIAIFKLDPILAYIWKSELCQHFAFISPAKCSISGSFDYWRSWSSAELVWEVFPRGANWPPRSGACCKTDTECTWPSFYPRRSKEPDRQIILGLWYSVKSDQKQRDLNLSLPND